MALPAIVVDGHGGLPDEIARQLRLAGAPPLHSGAYAADATESALRLPPRHLPRVVVLVGSDSVAVDRTETWQRWGVPHLPIVCNERRGTVGPLIVPGESSCWVCHGLRSGDLNALSPHVRPLSHTQVPLAPHGLGVLVASVATAVALAAVSGKTALAGVSTEITVKQPTVVHRFWPPHPSCHACHQRGPMPWLPKARETIAG